MSEGRSSLPKVCGLESRGRFWGRPSSTLNLRLRNLLETIAYEVLEGSEGTSGIDRARGDAAGVPEGSGVTSGID
jgi:hypothetical protein